MIKIPYFIISEIGLPATLEQLAEEAAELSKAALKVARIIRKENPTPVTYEQAIANLEEEAADVRNCLRVVCGELDIITIGTEALKMRRWAERLAEVKGGDPDA